LNNFKHQKEEDQQISIEEQLKEKKRGNNAKIPTSEVRLDGNFHLPIPDKKTTMQKNPMLWIFGHKMLQMQCKFMYEQNKQPFL